MFPAQNPVIDYLTKIRDYGLEYISKRFYSKYPAKVVANTDPQQQGRVKVAVPALGYLLGTGPAQEAQTLPKYAYPTSPYAGDNHGFYFPPEPDAQVWVWFDHGHPTQPHISGGFWNNNGDGQPKPAGLSMVPVEFNSVLNANLENNSATVDLASPTITTRGIKTGGGHGLLFEDDPVEGATRAGRETRVELWSGQAQAPVNGTPLPAIKKHRIVLSDFLKKLWFKSYGGHQTTYDDNPATQGIETTSIYGHTFKFDDVTKQILLKTKLGHEFLIDDSANQIMMKTVTGNTMVLSDPAKTITVQTPGQQSIVMNDAAMTIAVTSPGVVAVNATTVNATAAGAATVTAGGLLQLTAQGINITSQGTAPCKTIAGGLSDTDFTGLVTEKYQGGLIQQVTGPWAMTPTVGTINSADIQLGTGTRYVILDERFLSLVFNNHQHTGPTGPVATPFRVGLGEAVAVNQVATTNVKAS